MERLIAKNVVVGAGAVGCATAHHPPILAGAEVVATETRLYTVAPDERSLVDVHPARPDVFVASPCGGHGFKFSILVGRVLADMATGLDVDPRFNAWKREFAPS